MTGPAPAPSGLPQCPLGLTQLHVTSMGLGLAALGRPAYITAGRDVDLGSDRGVEDMERATHAVLDAAYQAGIRYIDTARSYGRAEEFLCSWLDARGLGPDHITVGSKWGYAYTGGWAIDAPVHEVKDHSLSALRTQLPESIKLLGRRLSLYQVHSATIDSGVLDDREVLGELLRVAERGPVVGLTVSGPHQVEVIRRALKIDIDGQNPFRCVQATWNLLEPSAAPALAEARRRGWGVIVKEALANGRLSDRQPSPRPARLGQIASRRGVSSDQIALAAAISQPWADVVLSGAVTPTQLRSNLGALALRLTADEIGELTSTAEPPTAYWHARSKLRWS